MPSSISFLSDSTASYEENGTGIVRNVDASLGGANVDEGLTYSITGGNDQALFNIDSTTGALSFISSPDYENPLDVGADNIYNVTVTASGGGSNPNSQDLTITVTNDVVEATGTPVTQGTIQLSGLDAGRGFTIGGGPAGNFAGSSVASAGDINGDGFADVVIGAPNSWYYSSGSGMAYVIFGHAGDSGTTVDVTSLDGSNGFAMSGLAVGNSTGGSVASAGDVNGDGYDDLLVSAYSASPNGNMSGQTYLIFGNGSGFPASVDLSSLNGSNGVTFNGSGAYDMAGVSVAAAGDINGDGIDDFLIGARGSIPFFGSGTSAGKTYVVFGNGSGFGASVDLASLDGSNGFVVNGIQQFDMAGTAVSSAGDVNGDGYDDILIGAPGVGSYTGAAYVLFGSASGFSASVDLASLDGTNGFALPGLATGDDTGWSVSSAGDINGDGYDDIMIGASTADTNGSDSGTTYVVFGAAGGFPASVDLSALNGSDGFVLNGGSSGDRAGKSVSAAGDLNGDGYADILIGAAGQATNGSYSGGTYVLLGHGGSFGASLNLSTIASGDGSTGFMLAGIDANDASGRAVATAGDINGDGFPDFIIGAPQGDFGGNNSGEAYVVYGEPVTPAVQFASSADLTMMENTTGVVTDINASLNGGNADEGLTYSITGGADQADFSIDSLTGVLSINTTPDYEARNDVGNDNVYQVTVTASGGGTLNNQQALNITITNDPSDDLPGVDQLFALDGTNGTAFNGIGANDWSGRSISSAGDVNGDGYADIIIGAQGANANGGDSGQSYVVFGTSGGFGTSFDLSSLDGSNGFAITGAHAYDKSGHSVSSAGDVNGDGYDDLLVGAYAADPNGYSSGSTYVIFGSASGFAANVDLASLDGTNGFVLNGTAAYEDSGWSVSSAGDVNGDGYDDILIGAYRAATNGANSGATYVVFGSASGFAASTDLSTLNGTNGFVLNGASAGEKSGWSVSSAGDVNGDGYADILIGAYKAATANGSQSGATYVVFGSGSGFAASTDLASLDGSNGFVIDGANAYDWSGFSVSSAGDVNGDGYDDILIGAHGADPNGAYSGAAYVVFGSAGGFSPTLDLSSLDGTNGFAINGANANDRAGFSVSSAGDINGDGYDDILVGSYLADPYFNNAGATYVIYGSASGFGPSIELSSLAAGDRSVGYVINGAHLGDSSGKAVAAAGDVNGDGADDLLIGAPYAAPHATNNGQTYLLYGTLPPTPAVIGGNTSGSIGENATSALTGHLTISDVNGAAEESFNGDTLDGTYGSLTIDANGDWSYDLNGSNATVQALQAGDTLGDTLTVHSVDGTAQDIVITIDGANDAPSAPVLTSSGVEENAAGAFVGTLSAHDPEGSAVTFRTDDSRFHIIDDQLWLRDGVSLDYETTPSLSVQVYASDAQGLNSARIVQVSVLDVVEGEVDKGTNGNDSIMGTGAGDTITGGAGNDTLDGGAGNDTITKSGSDTGHDVIVGGAGNDRIGAGGGNDFVVGDGASDGANHQILNQNDNTGVDGSDTIMGGNGDDTLLGGGWDDSLVNDNGHYDDGEEVEAGTGKNTIWAGQGNDVAVGSGGDDRLGGGANDDYLKGLDGNDTLFGGAGDDTLLGGTGDDLIYNGQGNDSVEGGAGADTLWAGAGDDTLTGGAGADTFVFGAVSGDDTITDFDTTEDSLDLASRGFADLAALTAASTETTVNGQSGLLIDLGGGDSVFLAGLVVSNIGSMDITL
ncbi:beta strand repeat-containing protein [Kordiimonas marina]|uniref:beta strand repeat-containing protein n=1 Tax=Kordiimonas marina TaxID=2872312 RepID=UPI001FF62474|nr:VCBS domain-containing protein [Kordiimonas marina]MCJ9430065.1 FG-GAP-like repeat-containing protein [Kordiimonas marina]